MEEQPTNETTSNEEQVVESGQTEAEPQVEVSSNAGIDETAETPTDKTVESEPAWDAKTSYEALQKNYDQVNQSYAELRREFTRRTQNEAELQKKLDNLTDTISKATEKPIDPKQFFNDLQTQGPKAIDSLFAKREAALRDEFDKQRAADREEITQMQFETAKLVRRSDTTNYPDFQKLEPIMAKLVQDEKISLNMDEGAGAIMDTLYKLAKNMNADKAIQEAKEIGRRESDARAAKEANARVAGSGKTGQVADPDKLSLADLRARMIQEIGLADTEGQ